MKRRILLLTVAAAVGVAGFTAPSASAETTYTQTAISVTLSAPTSAGAVATATTTVSAAVQTSVAQFGVCVRNAAGNNFDFWKRPGTLTETGTASPADSRVMPTGTYTAFACVNDGEWRTVAGTPYRFSVGASSSPAPTPTPTVAANKVTKVLTFVEENHSLDQMRAGMPNLYAEATRYGYATAYTAIRHPSLPNYLAIAGGSTYGVTDNAPPSIHRVAGPSIFSEAIRAGKTAKSYQESMVGNCALNTTGPYAVKHNPWAYFADDRANCRRFDVPSGTHQSGELHDDIVNGDLPNVGEVTPNLDNDAHDGSLGTADAWLENWLDLIMASPDWKSGHLAVIVTADEDASNQNNTVLTTVIHPSQNHNVVTTPLNHYSLTRLHAALTRTPPLGAAASAPDMAEAFGLPIN